MTLQAVLPILAPLVAVAIVVWRAGRPRHLQVPLLLATPVLVAGLILAAVAVTPHRPFGWPAFLGFGVAVVAGLGVGAWRGRQTAITLDPDGRVVATASRAAMVFLLGLFGARFVLRQEASVLAAAWRIDPAVVLDALLLFALGMVVASRGEMFLRARRLIAGAAAARQRPGGAR